MPTIVHRTNHAPTNAGPFPWQVTLSPWQQFRRDPARYLIQWLYARKSPVHPPSSICSPPTSIVCISDTHCTQPEVPDGDVLLHAGDLTNKGTFEEIQAQLDWIKRLPHRHKIVIAGNHDVLLDPDYITRHPDRIYEGVGTSRTDLDWGDVVYLNGSSTCLNLSADGTRDRSLKIYGSPWTEQYGTWAFQYSPIRDIWTNAVPNDTDILLVHGPPKGHLDSTGKGCPHLLREIRRVRPRLVVFGHIHAGYGREEISYDDGVQRAYDSVMTTDRGLGAVVSASFWVGLQWLCLVLSMGHCSMDKPGDATFVNAAVLGVQGKEQREPMIIWI